jgi:hypothetical protein
MRGLRALLAWSLTAGVTLAQAFNTHEATQQLQDDSGPDRTEQGFVEDSVFTLQACGLLGGPKVDPKQIWPNQRIDGAAAREATLYVFSAAAKHTDEGQFQLKMIAFVLDKKPRYLYDHIQTSNDSAALLEGVSCVFSNGASTKVKVHVETVQDEGDLMSSRDDDDGQVMGPYIEGTEDNPQKIQGAIELVCDVPAQAAKQMDQSKNRMSVVGFHQKGKQLLEVPLCGASDDSSDVDMDLGGRQETNAVGFCMQPFHSRDGSGSGSSSLRGDGEGSKGLGVDNMRTLSEWVIYHHHIMGVGHFYMYDRDANLKHALMQSRLLRRLLEEGVVVVVPW